MMTMRSIHEPKISWWSLSRSVIDNAFDVSLINISHHETPKDLDPMQHHSSVLSCRHNVPIEARSSRIGNKPSALPLSKMKQGQATRI